MSAPLQFERTGDVSVIRLDDGKANAVSHALLDALDEAFDRAEKEGGAIALLGRPGRFSAGFDLSVMSQGPEAVQGLVGRGADLLVRMLRSPAPIVAGATGHALAMGSLILLAADSRIGAAGEYKVGLNEVAIGMVLPRFAVSLSEDRLSKRHLLRATTQAEIYDPAGAVDAGFLDRLVDADGLEAETLAEAARLATLPRGAFAGTKRHLRSGLADRIENGLDAERSEWALVRS